MEPWQRRRQLEIVHDDANIDEARSARIMEVRQTNKRDARPMGRRDVRGGLGDRSDWKARRSASSALTMYLADTLGEDTAVKGKQRCTVNPTQTVHSGNDEGGADLLADRQRNRRDRTLNDNLRRPQPPGSPLSRLLKKRELLHGGALTVYRDHVQPRFEGLPSTSSALVTSRVSTTARLLREKIEDARQMRALRESRDRWNKENTASNETITTLQEHPRPWSASEASAFDSMQYNHQSPAPAPHPKPQKPIVLISTSLTGTAPEVVAAAPCQPMAAKPVKPSVSPLDIAIQATKAARTIQSAWRKKLERLQRSDVDVKANAVVLSEVASKFKVVEPKSPSRSSCNQVSDSLLSPVPATGSEDSVSCVSDAADEDIDHSPLEEFGVAAEGAVLPDHSDLPADSDVLEGCATEDGVYDAEGNNEASVSSLMWIDDEWSFLEEGRCTMHELLDSPSLEEDRSVEGLVLTKPHLVVQMQEAKRLQNLKERRQTAITAEAETTANARTVHASEVAGDEDVLSPMHEKPRLTVTTKRTVMIVLPATSKCYARRLIGTNKKRSGGKLLRQQIKVQLRKLETPPPRITVFEESNASNGVAKVHDHLMPTNGTKASTTLLQQEASTSRVESADCIGETPSFGTDATRYVVFSDEPTADRSRCSMEQNRNDLIVVGDLAVAGALICELQSSVSTNLETQGQEDDTYDFIPLPSAVDDADIPVDGAMTHERDGASVCSSEIADANDHQLGGVYCEQGGSDEVLSLSPSATGMLRHASCDTAPRSALERLVNETAELDASRMQPHHAMFPSLWQVELEVKRTLERIHQTYSQDSGTGGSAEVDSASVASGGPMASLSVEHEATNVPDALTPSIPSVDPTKQQEFLQVLDEFKQSLEASMISTQSHQLDNGSERISDQQWHTPESNGELPSSAAKDMQTGDSQAPHRVGGELDFTHDKANDNGSDDHVDDTDSQTAVDEELRAMLSEILRCKEQIALVRRGTGE